MNHEEKKDMPKPMHGPDGMHHHHGKIWQNNWKSPVSLGIFLPAAALTLAVLLYTVLNLVVSVTEAIHPQSQGMSQQQLEQELEQASPSSATAPTGAAAQ